MGGGVKVLVTGAKGFIGSNLVVALGRAGADVVQVDVDLPSSAMVSAVRGAEVIYHLAGVNRPTQENEFEPGNVGSLKALLAAVDQATLTESEQAPPVIVLSSSTQASQDTGYGRSKLSAEQVLEFHASRTGSAAVIYRLPGVFGKWCRPNYNSVVATFCHNVARDLPIEISDPNRVVELVYVDDVVRHFMTHLASSPAGVFRAAVKPTFSVRLGELAAHIRGFRASRNTLEAADASDPFLRRLLATFTSYLELQDLSHSLEQWTDARGALAELLKSPRAGQIFLSRTRPGITRGNHYHDTKVEKFFVVEGEGVIRFRPLGGKVVTEYRVSGRDFKVVDIPPGVTHSIENVGNGDMIVLFWSSEIFDPEHPDTYPSDVLPR